MKFRSIGDANQLILQKLELIPEDVDLIVGVPRSGMLPATLLALHLDLPLTDVEGFLSGRLMQGGTTRGKRHSDFHDLKHALVVDDSVFSGGTFRAVKDQLRNADFPKISYCAIYGSEQFHDPELTTFETLGAPRAFEWNIMYHPFLLKHACVDIDGILCFDPKREHDDGGKNYRRFVATARRRILPRGEVGALVTSRLEKYRGETEQWLKRTGIRYGELHMLNLPDEETRRRLGGHAAFKASVYKKSKAYVFIESEEWQAREIAKISGRPTLCLSAAPRMFYGSAATPRGFYWHFKKSPVLRRIFGKS